MVRRREVPQVSPPLLPPFSHSAVEGKEKLSTTFKNVLNTVFPPLK